MEDLNQRFATGSCLSAEKIMIKGANNGPQTTA